MTYQKGNDSSIWPYNVLEQLMTYMTTAMTFSYSISSVILNER